MNQLQTKKMQNVKAGINCFTYGYAWAFATVGSYVLFAGPEARNFLNDNLGSCLANG
jgi:hypothetical protein